MNSKKLFTDVLALLSAVLFTVLMVAGIASEGENLFAALLVFAFLVPMVASAAVVLQRDVVARIALPGGA